jgi:2-polyprenyl-3-methyl-5-hydroxy-6-metoxy-1,4-benzoquinol methylase
MKEIATTLQEYYTKCFAEHGASPRGVDWHNWQSLVLHYEKMLAVIEPAAVGQRVSLLDVGCGFGGLLDYAKSKGMTLDYSGIDIVPAMITHGQKQHPEANFSAVDIFEFEPKRVFDYVVCNGVLTEKLDVSSLEFDKFVRRMVRRMFELARQGIAFNLMTTQVNFTAPNLFYKNPLEMIAFCTAELSSKFVIDHAYPHYDYTMYVYRDARKA